MKMRCPKCKGKNIMLILDWQSEDIHIWCHDCAEQWELEVS